MAGCCGPVGGTGDARDHRHRGDADRRIRRPVRLGLRRRRSVTRRRTSMAVPTTCGRSSTARTRSGSASSWTSSTTISVRPGTTSACSRRPTSPTGTRTNGATPSISTAPTPVRCASSSSPTRATGSTSFTSTGCGSTPRSRSSTRRRRNVMAAIGDRVREKARSRRTIIVAENEPQDTRLVRPAAQGGFGLDALWNDDFHHSAIVALTGRAEAYYSDTRGTPQEFVSAAKYGYLFQGQYYHWQRKPRGTPALDLPPSRFVVYLQNHDQVANSARGLRGHQLASAGQVARDDRATCCWRRARRCCSRDRNSRLVQPVPVFRRPRRGAGRRGQDAAVPNSCGSFPASRHYAAPPDSGRSRRRADVLALQTRLHRARDQRSRLRAAPRSAGAAADPRGVPQPARAAASTAPCCSASAFVLRYLHGDHRRRARADRQPRAGPEAGVRSPSRSSRRRPIATGSWSGPVKIPGTAGEACPT